MQKFKKNRILIIGGISLVLVSGISFGLKIKEENKSQKNSRELIAMFIQDENGEYSANTSKEFPKEGYELNLEKSTCKNGGILSQDLTTKKISMRASHADQCTLYFDKTISSLKEFFDNITKKTNTPDFDSPATTDETADGLFSMEDDYGMSYYYRGTAPNNYVKFGQNASGQDMWWRIIRFNGDGTVRMQYDGAGTVGTNTYTRGFALTNQVWNSNNNDAKYLGWMFGGAQGSASTSKAQAQRNETNTEVKTKVDEWYKKNIVDTGYSNYIADAIFCNDRSTPGKSETEWTDDTGLGYGNKSTGYGSIARIAGVSQVTVTQPRFTCPQANDKFTVEKTSGGNGALTYPVGLITADEIVTAGSGRVHIQNSSYYLYKENTYLTFSPQNMGSNGRAYIFVIYSGGNLSDYGIVNSNAVAPVINLKAEYLDQFQGNGTIDNPYFLQV